HILFHFAYYLGPLLVGLVGSLSTNNPYPQRPTSKDKELAFGGLLNSGTRKRALVQSVLYLQYSYVLRLARKLFRREPAISVFDWLSPLPTPHPRIFQHTWVRASSQCYLTFTLDIGRSHGFGSTTSYYTPYSDSLSLRLRIFYLTLHGIVPRRSILQKVCRHP